MNEQIARWLYRTLRIGTHLSFHWTLPQISSGSYLSSHACALHPLAQDSHNYFILLELHYVSNLVFRGLITAMADVRLQLWSARSTPHFPFPFSLAQASLQALSAGVGRLHL
ncbi:Hypothetical_protein [Hexamita inflata]|uniref:Hypothetical_protein n=1 Tax=Hexamita inflata TaxID=28002 RepID=A0AA86TQM3_9EUKA|nr:Hypothetical protein HINF_LOCUS13319 [Hexamita inflata]